MGEFPAPVVELPDCQMNWDFLNKILNGSQVSNVPTTPGETGVRITFGLATGTWPGASVVSNVTNITHDLGKTPVAVLATLKQSPSAAWFPVVATVTYGATTFGIQALTSDGSLPAAGTVYIVSWLAIG